VPTVSVVLPTFNRAPVLARAIHSVLSQTFRDLELIIVDDASRDSTKAVVAQFHDERLHYHRIAENRGCAAARNWGIHRANGELIAFQDSDDEWCVHKLETQLAFYRSLPGDRVAGVGCSLMRYGPGRAQLVRWPTTPGPEGHVETDAFIRSCTAYLQSLLLRRDVLAEQHGFNEGLTTRSDFELGLRILSDYQIYAQADPLVVSHESADGLSGNVAQRVRSSRQILALHDASVRTRAAAWVPFQYDLARYELSLGAGPTARARLRGVLRERPMLLRAWVWYGLSLLGARGTARVPGMRR